MADALRREDKYAVNTVIGGMNGQTGLLFSLVYLIL